MSCGVKGNMIEYYKFHRSNTPIGCERSCAMLNSTDSQRGPKEKINFSTDLALAFFTASDTFGKLQSLRKLGGRNFICMGNKTSSEDTQCFRMIVGGGTNLVDPIWQFCNITSIPATAVVEFCVRDWTECSARIIDQPNCGLGGGVDQYLPTGPPGGSSGPPSDPGVNPPPGGAPGVGRPTTGMYMLLYDDKGFGWSLAEYTILFLPVTLTNMALSYFDMIPIPMSVGPTAAKTTKTDKADEGEGDDMTDDTQDPGPELGSDSGFDPSVPSPDSFTVVATGSLGMGEQTGYASFCLVDGCYIADISVGVFPENIAWVLCGVIGAAGMEGVFEVSRWSLLKYHFRGLFSVFCP